ncbi:hypothetical protein IFM89_032756 [Coptis chinensis]|uniref:YTH domain-containing family protein n=1 Tax=Coptis chinensis TaxID=261450 RepID=A0A835HIE3_9MAGN|nr:hypothetical protein IFM89_032756 [Coptis chinensis]
MAKISSSAWVVFMLFLVLVTGNQLVVNAEMERKGYIVCMGAKLKKDYSVESHHPSVLGQVLEGSIRGEDNASLLSEKEIVDNVMLAMTAGHDTSSVLITFIVQLLGNNPVVYATVLQDAQEKLSQKGSKCPVFLFFSVTASGQFCGVAETIGRVEFNGSMDIWQQDKRKRIGFFPVKWHFIKDVPNSHFCHMILENDVNKPVTESRDNKESIGVNQQFPSVDWSRIMNCPKYPFSVEITKLAIDTVQSPHLKAQIEIRLVSVKKIPRQLTKSIPAKLVRQNCGLGTRTGTKSGTFEEISVSFDLQTLYIPPLNSATTRFLGLPLPPLLKIDIVPELFQGTIDEDTGKVKQRTNGTVINKSLLASVTFLLFFHPSPVKSSPITLLFLSLFCFTHFTSEQGFLAPSTSFSSSLSGGDKVRRRSNDGPSKGSATYLLY